jgi:hypothetical protein
VTLFANQYGAGKRDDEFPSWVNDWRRYDYAHSPIEDMPLQAHQSVSFHSDDSGRSNRILHARGVLLNAKNTEISLVQLEGMYKDSDGSGSLDEIKEVWLLRGTSEIYVFLPKGLHRELVGKIYSMSGNWMDEVAALIKNDDPCVQTIRIC